MVAPAAPTIPAKAITIRRRRGKDQDVKRLSGVMAVAAREMNVHDGLCSRARIML
jgi:hypothetical protein